MHLFKNNSLQTCLHTLKDRMNNLRFENSKWSDKIQNYNLEFDLIILTGIDVTYMHVERSTN